MDVNMSNITVESDAIYMTDFERNFKFYFLLLMLFPSLCCAIFMLYHFNKHRLHSQIYGILLIVNALIIITELPFTLTFLHEGSIKFSSICTFWIVINYTLFLISIILMAWTSIERYLFIYHEQFMLRHIILLHYAPIITIILYSIFFYIGSVLLYKCQPVYDVHLYVCGGACYQYRLELRLIDMIVNAMGSVITTFVLNLILIIRHVLQRYYMKRSVIPINKNLQWRRSFKLSVQLISTSILYLITWLPYATIRLIQIFKNTPFLTYLLSTYLIYLPYIPVLSLPFTCLLAIPDLKRKSFSMFTSSCNDQKKFLKNRIHIMNENQYRLPNKLSIPLH